MNGRTTLHVAATYLLCAAYLAALVSLGHAVWNGEWLRALACGLFMFWIHILADEAES